MDFGNSNNLITILINALEKKNFKEDEEKIKYFCKELEKIKNNLPTLAKLDELQKIKVDLEIKYDDFNELSYYFDPLYVKIKNKIHDEKIKKIREENKRKRGIK